MSIRWRDGEKGRGEGRGSEEKGENGRRVERKEAGRGGVPSPHTMTRKIISRWL